MAIDLQDLSRRFVARSEPAFLKWRGMEAGAEGDFFVRSGPGTVKLSPVGAREYIRTRFSGKQERATSRAAHQAYARLRRGRAVPESA